jgi:hypothetical protein
VTTTRITDRDLQSLVDRLNTMTDSPAESWKPDASGRNRAQIGNFHLSFAYGGVCLHRMSNESGGVSTPLVSYHTTRRELWQRLHSFIDGLEFAKRAQS